MKTDWVLPGGRSNKSEFVTSGKCEEHQGSNAHIRGQLDTIWMEHRAFISLVERRLPDIKLCETD